MPLARGRVLTTLASDYESTKIVNMPAARSAPLRRTAPPP